MHRTLYSPIRAPAAAPHGVRVARENMVLIIGGNLWQGLESHAALRGEFMAPDTTLSDRAPPFRGAARMLLWGEMRRAGNCCGISDPSDCAGQRQERNCGEHHGVPFCTKCFARTMCYVLYLFASFLKGQQHSYF